jgi:hypothetical protein
LSSSISSLHIQIHSGDTEQKGNIGAVDAEHTDRSVTIRIGTDHAPRIVFFRPQIVPYVSYNTAGEKS